MLNKYLKDQESEVPVDQAFLRSVRNRLLENQAALQDRPSQRGWWAVMATAGAALGLVLAVTFLTRTTPLAPQVAFASAFENTFGASLTDFFFSGEGTHMQWSVTRYGQFEGTTDIWKADDNFRIRTADEQTVYDSLRLKDKWCVYAENVFTTGELSCQDPASLVNQDVANLNEHFWPTTLSQEVTVTPATDTTHDVTGWVVSWETEEPYVLKGGDTMESWAAVDGVEIYYVEGARAYGGHNVLEVAQTTNPDFIHSMYDVVNEQTSTGYRQAAFFAHSQSNQAYGFTFQIVENEQGGELYHYTPGEDLVTVTDRDELFTELAREASYTPPVDSRMFQALYVARDMEAFTSPLETRSEELSGRTATYYRFQAPSESAEFATTWKKTILLDGPGQIFEFWVDEELGKIVKYRVSAAQDDSVEVSAETGAVPTELDQWEATLLIDEAFAGPLTFETWETEVK